MREVVRAGRRGVIVHTASPLQRDDAMRVLGEITRDLVRFLPKRPRRRYPPPHQGAGGHLTGASHPCAGALTLSSNTCWVGPLQGLLLVGDISNIVDIDKAFGVHELYDHTYGPDAA